MEKIIEYLKSNKSGIASVLKEQNVYVFNETELINLIKQCTINDVSNSLPTHEIDVINGNFAQAERALLRIDPSGEKPDPTEIHELLQWFRDKLLGNDC